MGWRKPDVPTGSDFDGTEEDWNGKTFFWLPVTTLFGKPIGLEDVYNKLIGSISKEGLTFIPNPRILLETGLFSSKWLVEIEKPENYNAQVITIEASKVHIKEATGDDAAIKRVIERMRERVVKDEYRVQAVYQWFLSDPPWSLNKVSRTVVFVRI